MLMLWRSLFHPIGFPMKMLIVKQKPRHFETKHLHHLQLQDLAKYQPASPGTTILGRSILVEGGVGLISNPQNITKMTRKPWCAKALPQWVWWCTVIVNHLDVSLCMSHHTGTRKAKVTKEPSVFRQPRDRVGGKQAPKTAASMHSGTSCKPWVCVVITSYKIQ